MAALQRMALVEGFGQRCMHLRVSDPLDRGDLATFHACCKMQAAASTLSVDKDRARSASTVFATNMRALQARCMPNIVGQKITRLDLVREIGRASCRERVCQYV